MAKIVQTHFLDKLEGHDRLAILPCAGYGTRVGSPAAKELLPHPRYSGFNFLEKALERIKKIKATPLVVSRFDKDSLNSWLLNKQIPHIRVTQTSEWVESVWLTKKFWKKNNLLILPDTDFSPESILEDLIECELGAAVFSVENLRPWGGIKNNMICEKLRYDEAGDAWGILSFSKDHGSVFWENYEKARASREWVEISLFCEIRKFRLKKFEDLTREG